MQYSVIEPFGDDDTAEHVKLATCRTVGCDNPATYYDEFCPRCREEIDCMGLRPLYPPGRFKV
jgi:hypothetical protein